ncbi:Probable transcriptional regulator, TetR family [Mycobacteroides abscessus subsp. massiliense]|uniref:TetR/AcrR family transcriptional regulator n=1 Tax=Mycobacteroides abscessus TaxID=36809 RepID=UPI0005DD6C40|nr:TetR/AcrR family transcriptional regulator [Mycobacteroides abscessus]MBN7496161.1 TetR/AcrR family transcriptional regulator [Mycobacteroides abscessus subsp. abscessus]MDO3070186.1 TetR/AcrR family transcriptional regulator [Mycobacteroides abscessus subsp. bolletii]RIU39530.1 TetR/AcrR family transcriptional regulator [Mycobacteroides abscessus]CPS11306.1 Probable transcriptional regulator%2C TetR family [Mycobacteroides abscessus]CPS27537.1 Probable transcriptional regulator%2C TetR fam
MPDTDAQERSLTGHEARWERHNSARQTRIVESAVALLDESAPGTEIPVQSIAKRAGLAKSVVYRQFEGREDLDRRIRSYLLEDFDTTISSQLDVNNGSIIDIATRTIRAVLDWMTDYPHRYEFMRSGATDDDPAVDAISTVKVRMEQRVRGVLIPITEMLGIDYSPFESVTYAVVTMVEGSLSRWLREAEPVRTRAEIVEDLANYVWYVLDGAGGSVGVSLDPTTELMTALAKLSGANR